MGGGTTQRRRSRVKDLDNFELVRRSWFGPRRNFSRVRVAQDRSGLRGKEKAFATVEKVLQEELAKKAG